MSLVIVSIGLPAWLRTGVAPATNKKGRSRLLAQKAPALVSTAD
jgi:hypothetical protein